MTFCNFLRVFVHMICQNFPVVQAILLFPLPRQTIIFVNCGFHIFHTFFPSYLECLPMSCVIITQSQYILSVMSSTGILPGGHLTTRALREFIIPLKKIKHSPLPFFSPPPLFLAQLSFLLIRKKERILPCLVASCIGVQLLPSSLPHPLSLPILSPPFFFPSVSNVLSEFGSHL